MDILIFIPFLSILGISTFIANNYRVNFTFTVPTALSVVLSSLYAADVLGILYYTTSILIFIGIALLLLSFAKYPELSEKISKYKNEIILVTVILLFMFFFYKRHLLTIWDDLAFWGVFSKELFFNDTTFSQHASSVVLPSHYHYPRGPSYFHYFSMFFAGISESGLLTSHFMMHLLLAMPFFAGRYFVQGLILLMLIYLIPLKESFALASLYNDSTIGFVAVSCIGTFLLCDDKKKAIWLLIPTFFMFSVYREIGLWIGIYTGIIISTILFFEKTEESIKRKLVTACILIALPIISNYLWFLYVDAFGLLGRDTHKLSTIINIIAEVFAGNDLHLQVISALIDRFIRSLKLETFAFIYVVILLTSVIVAYYKKQYLKKYFILLFVTSGCFLLLMLFRLYLYILMRDTIYFSIEGAVVNIGCLIRYSASFLILYIAISAGYISKILNEVKVNKKIFILLAIVIFAVFTKFFLKKTDNLMQVDEASNILPQQIDTVNNMFKLGHDLSYDYSYKDLSADKQILKCQSLSFYLHPHFLNKDRDECINAEESNEEESDIKPNQTTSNININEVMENNDKYRCNLLFNPHYNYLDIKCKNKGADE